MRVETPTNAFVKCLTQPTRCVRARNGHEFEYQSLLAVDENHYPIHGTHTKSVSFERLRLNHYVTKSEEEARAKLGRPAQWNDSRVWRSRRMEEMYPQELDRTITSYVPAVREALERRAVVVPPPPRPA
jgi:hypothetical protein